MEGSANHRDGNSGGRSSSQRSNRRRRNEGLNVIQEWPLRVSVPRAPPSAIFRGVTPREGNASGRSLGVGSSSSAALEARAWPVVVSFVPVAPVVHGGDVGDAYCRSERPRVRRRQGRRDEGDPPSRYIKSVRRSTKAENIVMTIPLIASFLLAVVGAAAVIVINQHYAAEAGRTFPPALASSIAVFVRREVEAELTVPLRAHEALASSYRAGMMGPLPIYRDVTVAAASVALPTATAEDRALLEALVKQRAAWVRRASLAAVQTIRSTPNLVQLRQSFISDALSTWTTFYNNLGWNQLEGASYYGDDVKPADAATSSSRLFRFEAYRPPEDPVVPSPQALIEHNRNISVGPNGYYFFEKVQSESFFKAMTEEANMYYSQHNQSSVGLTIAPIVQFLPTYDMFTQAFEMTQLVKGPLQRGSDHKLVGISYALVHFEAVHVLMARLNTMLAVSNPTAARYRMSIFVLDPDGVLMAASNAGLGGVLNVTKEINLNSLPIPDRICSRVYANDASGASHRYIVCRHTPSTYAKDPMLHASAPFLPKLCRDRSPLLGVATSIIMAAGSSGANGTALDGSLGSYSIVCDELTLGGFRAHDIGRNFSSWRVVTIVSEREIVEPLLDGLPRSITVACAGLGVAAFACIVAAAVACVLRRHQKQEVASHLTRHAALRSEEGRPSRQ